MERKMSKELLKWKKDKEKMLLSAYIEPENFKKYISDIGLLCSKFGIPANIIIVENENMNNFKGALTENYVCSALVQCGLKPYYWNQMEKQKLIL